MGSASEFIDKDMNFNAINRLRLEHFVESEGHDAPWSDYAAALSLAFPAGLVWYSNGHGTIQFTYEPYEGDPTPGPGIYRVARHLEVPMGGGSSPISYAHNLNCFPTVQFKDSSAHTLLVPTNITWTNLNVVTATFTGTWPGSTAIFSG